MTRRVRSIGSGVVVLAVLCSSIGAVSASRAGDGFVPARPVASSMPSSGAASSSPLWQESAAGTPLATDTLVTTAQVYTGIAFSVIGADSSLAGVFNELGPYDPVFWRLFHWQPGSGSYAEGGSSIRRGNGYWLITNSDSRVGYAGTTANVDTFRIDLGRGPSGAPGWNQVGNPYPYPINMLGMVVAKRDSIRQLAAAGNPFTQQQVKVWNPPTTAYINGSTIAPNAGFWVRVTDPNPADAWTVWQVFASTVQAIDLALDSQDLPRLFVLVPGSIQVGIRPLEIQPNAWSGVYFQVPASDVQTISVRLDAANHPHLAYAGSVSSVEGLAYSLDLAVPELVTTDFSDGVYASMALSAQGFPRIAYGGQNYNFLRYAFRNANTGPWTVEDVDNRWSFNTTMQLDGNGVAHVAYVASDTVLSGNVLRYASRSTAGVWTRQGIEPDVGFGVSLALDRQGGPHICYVGADGELTYASRNGSSWVTEKIGIGTQGRRPSLTFDAQGAAHVSYFASSNSTLRHGVRSGAGWTVENVDVNPGSGQAGSTLVVDRLGRLHIAYSSGAGNGLCRYAMKQPGTVQLRIPAIAAAAPTEPPPSVVKPVAADWAVTLEARQGSRQCEPVWLGVAPGPDEVRTMLRSSAAPPPPGGALQLGIVTEDREDAARLADFRSPGEDRNWDLTLDGLRGPGEATLVAGAFDLPADARLWLSDPAAGWTRGITPGEVVTLAAAGSPKRLRLEVRSVTDPPLVALTGGFRGSYPNPFRAETGLRFVLGRPGDLEVGVFDLAGRKVRTLERRSATAGEHVLVWDGRSDDGHDQPAGIYLVRYAADGRSGSARVVKLD